MSSTATKSTDANKTDQPQQEAVQQQSQQSQLGALEEDDEFEEFPAQGTIHHLYSTRYRSSHHAFQIGTSQTQTLRT